MGAATSATSILSNVESAATDAHDSLTEVLSVLSASGNGELLDLTQAAEFSYDGAGLRFLALNGHGLCACGGRATTIEITTETPQAFPNSALEALATTPGGNLVLHANLKMIQKNLPNIDATAVPSAALATVFAGAFGYLARPVNLLGTKKDASGNETVGLTDEANAVLDYLGITNRKLEPVMNVRLGLLVNVDIKKATLILSRVGALCFTRTHSLGTYATLAPRADSDGGVRGQMVTRLASLLGLKMALGSHRQQLYICQPFI